MHEDGDGMTARAIRHPKLTELKRPAPIARRSPGATASLSKSRGVVDWAMRAAA